MLGDPFLRAVFDGDGGALVPFKLLPVMLDLAHLFDHTRAKQGVLVGEGDADQIVVGLTPTPGDDAWVTGLFAQQRDAHLYCGTAAKGATRVARHPAEADIVQSLSRDIGLPAQNQFHRHVAGMTQKFTHEH